jgi:hypothetical protein
MMIKNNDACNDNDDEDGSDVVDKKLDRQIV